MVEEEKDAEDLQRQQVHRVVLLKPLSKHLDGLLAEFGKLQDLEVPVVGSYKVNITTNSLKQDQRFQGFQGGWGSLWGVTIYFRGWTSLATLRSEDHLWDSS